MIDLKKHWSDQCQFSMFCCSECRFEVPKAEIDSHDCFTFLQEKLQEERDCLASEKRKYHALTGKDADDRTHMPNHCYKLHPIQWNDPKDPPKGRVSKLHGQWIETKERQCMVCGKRWTPDKKPYATCS